MSDWSQPPELHPQPAYDAGDVEAFVQHITARVAELERQVDALCEADAPGVEAKLGRDAMAVRPVRPGGTDRQRRAHLAEAERQAQARLSEADRYFAARLVEADMQAQTLLEQARREARALVDGVRRSLEDAVRLKDEEVLAALAESHDRVMATLDEKLRSRDGQQHEPPYLPPTY